MTIAVASVVVEVLVATLVSGISVVSTGSSVIAATVVAGSSVVVTTLDEVVSGFSVVNSVEEVVSISVDEVVADVAAAVVVVKAPDAGSTATYMHKSRE